MSRPVRFLAVSVVLAMVCLASVLRTPSPPGSSSDPLVRESAQVAQGRAPTEANRQRVLASYGKLPLTFIPNAGQVDSRVRYYARGSGYGFYLTPTEVMLALVDREAHEEGAGSLSLRTAVSLRDEPATARGVALALQFVGANPQVVLDAEGRAPGVVNYFVGNDPARWRTGIAAYKQVVYREIWPGIDMRVRGGDGKLKYEFLLQPGARVRDIRLAYKGAEGLALNLSGALQIETALGVLKDSRPISYQVVEGRRVAVESRYVPLGGANGAEYGFTVGGGYDRRYPLVIDPGLVYSTFLGGSSFDFASSVAVDAAGNAYLTGQTHSADFPTTPGAFDRTQNVSDAFVTKLNTTGSALVYSTFLGGSSFDICHSLAVDAVGNAYLMGETVSADFPTTPGALDGTYNGRQDAFVTKLNAGGSALVYSTFLGGASLEEGSGLAVDAAGNAYLTGGTDSADFPTTPGAFDGTYNGGEGEGDAFVTKLNVTGSTLVYSTFLGGSFIDDASSVAVDAAGNAYVTGAIFSSDFPTTPDAFDRTINGSEDGFVTKLNATGSALVYSTFLGGASGEEGTSLAVDAAGKAYVTGLTFSSDFPTTPGAFDGTNSRPDAFVTKLNATGSALVYSTFLGGILGDAAFSVAVDAARNAYLAGQTHSPDFPTTPGALDRTPNGSNDGFMAQLNAAGSALVYSTYLGGGGSDGGFGVAVDAARNAYLMGETSSADFPTTPGAFDGTFNNGGVDAFVTKLTLPTDVLCGGLAASIVGTSGVDRITGTLGKDVIQGLSGDDIILGVDGEDVICGGPGDDVIRSGNQKDSILGGPGDDTLYGNGGRDFLRGGDGEDTLLGGPGFDMLSGNEGDDLLDGGTENDRCDGGPQATGDVAQNCEVVVDVP